MLTTSFRCMLLGIALLAPVTAAAQAPGSFVLRPGVVVEAGRATLYMMRPGGGVEAVDVTSGRVSWLTSEATQPLQLAGDVLVAVADRPSPDGKNAAVDLMLLRARDGRVQRSVRARLPDGVWSSV